MEELTDDIWRPFDNGSTITKDNLDGPAIILDIENIDGARITIERNGAKRYFEITFGIYYVMFHTHFERSVENAYIYVRLTKKRIETVIDHYNVEENNRDDEWYSTRDILLNELVQR